MVRAGKYVGQTKPNFGKKSKTIDEVSSFFSFVLRSLAKLLFSQFRSNRRQCMKYAKIQAFSRTWIEIYPYFPVYGQNLQYTGKYGNDSVHIQE